MPMSDEKWADVTDETWLSVKGHVNSVRFVSDHPFKGDFFLAETAHGTVTEVRRSDVESRRLRTFEVKVNLTQAELEAIALAPESSASESHPLGRVTLKMRSAAQIVNESRLNSERERRRGR